MVDEREAHEAFEQLVGGPDRGFRLMRLWTTATQTVSGDKFQLGRRQRSPEEVFRRIAKDNGYNSQEIKAFLDLP